MYDMQQVVSQMPPNLNRWEMCTGGMYAGHLISHLCTPVLSYLAQLLKNLEPDEYEGVINFLGDENFARMELLYQEIIAFRDCSKEELPIKVGVYVW